MLRLAPWKVASILLLTLAAVLLVVPSFLSPDAVGRLQKALPSFLPRAGSGKMRLSQQGLFCCVR